MSEPFSMTCICNPHAESPDPERLPSCPVHGVNWKSRAEQAEAENAKLQARGEELEAEEVRVSKCWIGAALKLKAARERIATLEDQLKQAAEALTRGYISGGSGPVAPVFDAEDFEVESRRGAWVVIDKAAYDAIRAAMNQEKQEGR